MIGLFFAYHAGKRAGQRERRPRDPGEGRMIAVLFIVLLVIIALGSGCATTPEPVIEYQPQRPLTQHQQDMVRAVIIGNIISDAGHIDYPIGGY